MPKDMEKTLRECFHPRQGKPNLRRCSPDPGRAKQLERKYADTLEKAQETRVIEQYGVEIITNEDVEWIIEDAKDFVLKIEEVLAE
ncbi:MAG: hypothetical protein FD145_365 [Candidatus Saganbacteria bacterium]|uniref:Uncharacterized protein n=1 Tax=Candidatus Saganbacteria bacterium TaxID=2575572 RepID=A0A833NYX8_UNCSA|nr:MAG: hypothetical protein FD145_365 [Candidatus Saganbacteria bacterium]